MVFLVSNFKVFSWNWISKVKENPLEITFTMNYSQNLLARKTNFTLWDCWNSWMWASSSRRWFRPKPWFRNWNFFNHLVIGRARWRSWGFNSWFSEESIVKLEKFFWILEEIVNYYIFKSFKFFLCFNLGGIALNSFPYKYLNN